MEIILIILINSADDTSDTLDDIMKKARNYSDEDEAEEELSTRLAEDLTFQKYKYKSKPKVLHHKDNDLYDSGSDVDSEGKINTNGDSCIDYESNGFQTNLSKFAKEQFGKSFNGVTHSEYSTLDVAERSMERLKGAQLQRISDDIRDDVSIGNTEVPQQFSNSDQISLDKLFESNGINDSSVDSEKEDCTKEEGTKYLEDQPGYADMSREEIYSDTTYEKMETLTSSERKKVEKSSQQAYEKESTINRLNGSSQSVDKLEKEYLSSEAAEMPRLMYRGDEEISNKNDVNIGTQNKLNASLEDVNEASNNASRQTEQSNGAKSEAKEAKQASDKKKTINYNKEKLLATMKAIDNNENIEFLSQGFRNHNVTNRMQIMENLHRGLPAHSKPKRDIIRDIFEDNHIESKVRSTCSKSH